ncbi:MAG: NTP transferase domain-containing protein [Rhizobiales bacterium]|nr:NTP transferase domain-containing protein [Hyphomicrobiales bacterium]
MGGDNKSLKQIGGRPLIAHILDRIGPQASPVIINANGDAGAYSGFKNPVVPDSIDGFAGPLAGVLAGLDWAAG